MYTKFETSVASKVDGLMLSVLCIIPNSHPHKGIVQIAHGMCENKERYLPFMEYLADQGYISVIHDHRGHGKSVRREADLGYMYGGGAEAILTDMDMICDAMKAHFEDLPYILFGHSMGSLAVRAYTAKHDDKIDMLIVSGSPSENPMRGLGETVAKVEKAIFGPRHKSKILTALSVGSYAAKFKKEGPCAWLCTDSAVCEAYEQSPFCGFLFTDDAFLTLFGLMKRTYDIAGYRCIKPDLPILFVSGADDPCMENIRKFARAVHSIRYAGYRNVRGKVYPDMRHEILNEKEHEKVFRDIVTYMGKKIGK